MVGEVSAPAEAYGIVRGMRLGEAMSRCPALRLVAPDPRECARSGGPCSTGWRGSGPRRSDPGGLLRRRRPSRHPRRRPHRRLAAARRALGAGRALAGAEAMASHAAALQVRPRRGRNSRVVVPRRPTSSRRFRLLLRAPGPSSRRCPRCRRLGIRTLGELAALPSRAVAERFGHPGLLALDLSRGRDTPLDPRRPFEPVVERLDLPEAASGQQLERALELLIARVLARRERRGRSLRGLAVSARFVAGGTWRTAVTLRHASADPARIRLTLAQKLAELPAPSESLALEVEAFGPLHMTRAAFWTRRTRCAVPGWARRSGRRARRRGPTPPCGCWTWTPIRASRSAGRCWRRSPTRHGPLAAVPAGSDAEADLRHPR